MNFANNWIIWSAFIALGSSLETRKFLVDLAALLFIAGLASDISFHISQVHMHLHIRSHIRIIIIIIIIKSCV